MRYLIMIVVMLGILAVLSAPAGASDYQSRLQAKYCRAIYLKLRRAARSGHFVKMPPDCYGVSQNLPSSLSPRVRAGLAARTMYQIYRAYLG